MSEEITGIDLVREMFRIAEGEEIGYDDPPVRGHSIEFRINAEDPGRNFMPAPGTIRSWRLPAGPGVRVDAGYEPGMTVPQAFDSLIAKLIVTGADRRQAIERARRALAEFEVDGMPTVLPFHRALVSDPAFTSEPMFVHTRWIEADFRTEIPPLGSAPAEEPAARERMVVEVGGRRLEVVVPAALTLSGAAPVATGALAERRGGRPRHKHERRPAAGPTSPAPCRALS